MSDASRAYSRGYNRGYLAGSRGRWPEHKPPLPPDEMLAKVFAAALALRNAVDGELATFGEDDEITQRLGPLVDDLDDAMVDISKWLKTAEASDACDA